ncbi:ubiquitin-like domain-containing protein [Phenylobacterium sp.]|uniref:ubiquitin-like domain-containing protein n=1 Tax=Phenylobacterium sp. TaxID=1871053 RepID=UPI002F3E435F
MQIGVDQSYVLGLFNNTNTNSNGIINLDLSSLMTGTSESAAANVPAQPVAPTPPWDSGETPAQTTAAVQSALAGQPIVNPSAAQLDLPGASTDYRNLFALYQGLGTLQDIATQAQAKGNTPVDQTQLAKAFASGLNQISSFVGTTNFDQLRLADGSLSSTQAATLTVPKAATSYVTPPIATSGTDPVPAFQGSVQFNISIKRIGVTYNVPINLDDMGSQPRNLVNVLGYVNQQLAAAGVETRFQTQRTPGQPNTVTVGGKPFTLPTSTPDEYALKVVVGTGETVSFSAPATAGAVYVAQTVGDPNPDHDPTTNDSDTRQQLLKFQTDTTNVDAPPQIPGQANFVPGRTFADTLGPEVKDVHATQVGSDGSVYVLADVTGTTAGQALQGTQDVALLKYDSAGKLIYTRTLGAAGSATGLGLAVSADGKVAVTGSLTGTLTGSTDGALNSGDTGSFSADTDSFVTLYDSSGNEVWTARRGSRLNDEADEVAFGADGTVYVAGRAQGAMPGNSTPIGGYDGYIEAFTTTAQGTPKATFTQTFGTTGSDKPQGLVVSGNSLITASVENGHAVLRNYDISSGAPVLAATRDLGDLQGGNIAGLALNGSQVVVAGSTTNSALSAGTITRAASGGTDAFVATVSADLSTSSSDAIAYYGGAGNDTATALAVANGQVWIAGQAGADLPGQQAVGTTDGFLANINVATGSIDASQRFTGKDNMAVPSAIAVDPTGASVLDRLGLPTGTLTMADSQLLVAQSSLRAGDQFTVKPGDGITTTITIDPNETLKTLAQKIQRATGFEATVTVGGTLNGQQQLHISPVNPRMTIEIGAGKGDKDALGLLGLTEGVIRATTTNAAGQSVPGDGKSQLYGLGLTSSLNLNDPSQISHAVAQVAAAMGVLRRAYQDLVTAASPKSAVPPAAAASASGTVPQYLTDQIANLQAGLARLTA